MLHLIPARKQDEHTATLSCPCRPLRRWDSTRGREVAVHARIPTFTPKPVPQEGVTP